MSKTFNLPILLACTTLAFALGWLAPKALHSLGIAQPPQQAAEAAAMPAVATSGSTHSKPIAEPELLSRFNAIDWSQHPPAGAEELAPALASSAALRTAALERYRQEPTGISKNILGQFLTAQPLPEIVAIATQWAQQADSASARADGFSLLGSLPPQTLTYRLARQALEQEKDPLALASAVWILSPPQGPADPAEVQQVVPRLHALTQHPVADIRSASVQRIVEWDRARRYATQDVLRLLSDPDAEVRMAALGACSIASLTDDSIKQRLLAMLANTKEEPQTRSIVALNLERFALSPKEYATYQAVQRELFGKQGAK